VKLILPYGGQQVLESVNLLEELVGLVLFAKMRSNIADLYIAL